MVVVLVAALAAPVSASAIGRAGGSGTPDCSPGTTWVQSVTSAESPSYQVRPGGGVITSWKTRAAPATSPEATLRFKVFRPAGSTLAGNPNYWVVGKSRAGTLSSPGMIVFPTRISVDEGDLIGLSVGAAPVDCRRSGETPDEVWSGSQPSRVGSSFAGEMTHPSSLLNLSAIVEEDADGDGFGDRTQDRCPSQATTQGPCEAPPDADPPETAITKSPPNRRKSDAVTYRFDSTEAGSAFECRLRGRGLKIKVTNFAPCTSPKRYERLDRGRYRFAVRATDAAGNTDSTPATDRFRIIEQRKTQASRPGETASWVSSVGD